MRSEELLIIFLVGGILLVMPLAALIVSITALVKMRQIEELSQRILGIETYLRRLANTPVEAALHRPTEGKTSTEESLAPSGNEPAAQAEIVRTAELAAQPAAEPGLLRPAASAGAVSPKAGSRVPVHEDVRLAAASEPGPVAVQTESPAGWETFIGQKAFGWVAVVLFLFSATFFLRYAYQNNWIGPLGRVAIGELAGVALIIGGAGYCISGWRRFSSMLMSAGIVVIYLSTYTAFAFYQLLPQSHAGSFLALIILESMVAAVLCRSTIIGMVAVVGGLMTPLLMQSDHDTYSSFFLYLLTLNLGVVLALCLRRWVAAGTVAFSGTQWLFWMWYQGNYHPEKFTWALGFQAGLFALYFAQTLIVAGYHILPASREELARFVLNALMAFVAFRTLTIENYSLWIGTAALLAAIIYAIAGRLILDWRPSDHRLLLTSLAVSTGFVAWAIPVQADVRWVALGWMGMSLALWLFGLRVASGALRLMAGVLACLAVGRILMFDLPLYVRDPFLPVFNREALPPLLVSALMLAGVWKSDRYLTRLRKVERLGIGVAGVVGTSLLWLILSLECHGYFVSQSMYGGDVDLWRWRAQLALTVFWTIFAILLLLSGFRFDRSRLRWLAMVLFGVTVIKLFVVDMANVQQIYRIVAFFVLSIVLGLVARAYQRFS